MECRYVGIVGWDRDSVMVRFRSADSTGGMVCKLAAQGVGYIMFRTSGNCEQLEDLCACSGHP